MKADRNIAVGVAAMLVTVGGAGLLAAIHGVTGLVVGGLLVLGGVYLLTAMALDWPLPDFMVQVHEPPGGGVPFVSPVHYQVRAIRQVVSAIEPSTRTFGHLELEAAFKNVQRRGTIPVYEPLRGVLVDEGLERLVELGELERVDLSHGQTWRIVRPDNYHERGRHQRGGHPAAARGRAAARRMGLYRPDAQLQETLHDMDDSKRRGT